MTPRTLAAIQLAAVGLLAAASLIPITGCDPRALAYFLQPFESTIPPKGPRLDEKKVLILCNVTASALAEYPSLERDLPRELANILRNPKKAKKVTVVDPDKVATWVEAHPHWTDPADAGRDFNADIVVFLEVEQFQTQSPGDLNMVHGNSKVHIQVFEMEYPKNSKDRPIKDQPKEAHNSYDEYAETSFPNRGPLPIDSGTSRGAFQHTFLKIVVKEVSWHFVDHREEDSIQDSRIEK
jgi:hypothetical protein